MPINIGHSIRIIRQAKGLLLKDVATAAAVSNPFLSLVEKGERQPSLDVLRRIALALEIPVEALILASQPAETTIKTTSEQTRGIMRSIEKLAAAEDGLRLQLEAQNE
jgi:transcriptional regulator with XRE-family HTH domain